jgi:hypothetical protein
MLKNAPNTNGTDFYNTALSGSRFPRQETLVNNSSFILLKGGGIYDRFVLISVYMNALAFLPAGGWTEDWKIWYFRTPLIIIK